MCDFSRVSAWFCDEKISLKKSCFYLYIRRRYVFNWAKTGYTNLADCGLPKERTYVTGSPMAEVLRENLAKIEASDVHEKLGLEKRKYILLSAHREENIDTEKNFLSLFNAINAIAEKYDMPILYSCHPRSRKRLKTSGFQLGPRVIQHEPLGFSAYT